MGRSWGRWTVSCLVVRKGLGMDAGCAHISLILAEGTRTSFARNHEANILFKGSVLESQLTSA